MSLIALTLAAALQTSATSGAAAAQSAKCRIVVIADLPVTFERNRVIVPVEIDGKPARGMIDTGAGVSGIFADAVQRLGLKTEPLPGFRISGADGEFSPLGARVPSFRVMGASLPGFRLPVLRVSETGIDVALGQDVFFFPDVMIEFDLANQKMKLLRSVGCADDELVYWAKAWSEAELLDQGDGYIRPDVRLNGVRTATILDSGAPLSIASSGAAFRSDVALGPATERKAGGIAGRPTATREGVVRSLTVGEEKIANAALTFGALYRHEEAADSASRIASQSGFEMLLGADFLRSHHVLISREKKRMWFTYNGGPIFRQDQSPRPAAEPPLSGKHP